MHKDTAGAAAWIAGWTDDVAVILLGCAAALFTVAGVVRLARWRLAGDPHSALAGCALIVMGALYLPLVGVAEISGALQRRPFGEAVARLIVTAVTIGLVVRATRTSSGSRLVRPSRLLPTLAAIVLGGFAALVVIEAALSEPVPGGSAIARALSIGMVLGWLTLAVAVRRFDTNRSWARRAAPIFGGLAVAEALHGTDPGNAIGNAGGLVVCTTVAALCVWSARIDLELALDQTDRTIGSLHRTLREAHGEAAALSEWRAHLVHDADNSVAGLRAALDVLNAREGAGDPRTARLCDAAAQEAQHLDHLLHATSGEPVEPFDAGAAVGSLAVTAQARGQDVRVHGGQAVAVGRRGDLVTVVENLLVNADRHAPGAHVDLTIGQDDDRATVVCWDDGPGLDERTAAHAFDRGFRRPGSTGSGLGLHEARALMRHQGGDLVLDHEAPGARFVATLPAARPLPGTVGPAYPRNGTAAS